MVNIVGTYVDENDRKQKEQVKISYKKTVGDLIDELGFDVNDVEIVYDDKVLNQDDKLSDHFTSATKKYIVNVEPNEEEESEEESEEEEEPPRSSSIPPPPPPSKLGMSNKSYSSKSSRSSVSSSSAFDVMVYYYNPNKDAEFKRKIVTLSRNDEVTIEDLLNKVKIDLDVYGKKPTIYRFRKQIKYNNLNEELPLHEDDFIFIANQGAYPNDILQLINNIIPKSKKKEKTEKYAEETDDIESIFSDDEKGQTSPKFTCPKYYNNYCDVYSDENNKKHKNVCAYDNSDCKYNKRSWGDYVNTIKSLDESDFKSYKTWYNKSFDGKNKINDKKDLFNNASRFMTEDEIERMN